MRSYEAARGLFSFLAVCSWVVIGLGAIVAFGGLSAATSFGRNAGMLQALAGATPGLVLAMLGFFGLALVQMGRANVDSAEYGQQSLAVARQQLEVSKQALQQNRQTAPSYATDNSQQKPSAATPAATEPKASYTQPPPKPTAMNAPADAPAIDKQREPSALPRPGLETPVSELLGEKVTIAGRELVLADGTYHYGSMTFSSPERAEAYFGQMGVNPNAKLQST